MAFWEWIRDPNLHWVMVGSILLGMSSGMLGTFSLLRRRSLMGDVLAHAALPGICLAFMFTLSKSLGVLIVGAVAAGIVAVAAVNGITRYSRIKEDTALALVLTVFYGLGIVLLTKIAQSGHASQSGLDTFLFGRAASMVGSDVQVIAAAAAVLSLVVAVLFHEFKLVCFNPQFARSLGRPVALLDNLLMLLIVIAVAIGLKAVGVVLMVAMLVTPAVAARYWTDRLSVMVMLAAAFGAVSGVLGTAISTAGLRLPTGPLIVLSATVVFLVSVVFAPERGLLSRVIRRLRLRGRVQRENILRSLFECQERAEQDPRRAADASATAAELAERRGESPARTARGLERLAAEGHVAVLPGLPSDPSRRRYRLTEQGMLAAYDVVRRHRLWEMFLMHEAQLAVDHVDRDADLLEHFLPEPVVAELERLLRLHNREPRLPASIHPISLAGGQ